jgi:FkbM family methyltransferase
MKHSLANLLYSHDLLTKFARQPYKLFRRGTPLPILLGYGQGLRFCREWNPTYNLGVYEYHLQEAISRMLSPARRRNGSGPGAVFYDLGANEGFFTVIATQMVGPGGQVVAFEPHPQFADYIRRNLKINNLHSSLVVFHQKAVGDVEGVAQLIIQGLCMSHLSSAQELLSHSWAETQPRYVQSGQTCEVELTTLDAVADRHGRPPDLVKIDVEGAEVAVLRGAAGLLKADPPAILCEFHSPETAALGGEILRKYGYSFYKVEKKLEAVQTPTFWTLALQGDMNLPRFWRPGGEWSHGS